MMARLGFTVLWLALGALVACSGGGKDSRSPRGAAKDVAGGSAASSDPSAAAGGGETGAAGGVTGGTAAGGGSTGGAAVGSGGAPADAGDDFAAGGAPVLITGVNLVELNLDNARVRCDFAALDSELHRITCRAAVMNADGNEQIANAIVGGVDASWAPPAIVDGIAEVKGCNVSANNLSQVCEVRLAAGTAKVALALDLEEKATARTKRASALVLLPYSVGIAAGFVPAIPFAYLTGPEDGLGLGDGSEATPEPIGLQAVSIPAAGATLVVQDLCETGGRIYVSDGASVRYLQDGKLTPFAGSPDDGAFDDFGDRHRISLGSVRMRCGPAGEIYLLRRKDSTILKLTDAKAVEVFAAKVQRAGEGSLGTGYKFDRTASGHFYTATVTGGGFLHVDPDGVVEKLPKAYMIDYAFSPEGDLYYGVSGTGGTEIRRVDGKGADTLVALAATDQTAPFACDGTKTCRFESFVFTNGTLYFLAWDGKTSRKTIHAVKPDGTVSRLTPPQELGADSLETLGDDLAVVLRGMIYRRKADGSYTHLAGRDVSDTALGKIAGTEAQFKPRGIGTAPNGDVVLRADVGHVAMIGGELQAYGFLGQVTQASTYSPGGAWFFLESQTSGGPRVHRTAILGSPMTRLASFPALPAGYARADGSAFGGASGTPYGKAIAARGETVYVLMTSGVIQKSVDGGAPTVVFGTLVENETSSRADLGEGKSAATFGFGAHVEAIAVGPDELLYFVDADRNGTGRVRRIDADGMVRTLAGGDGKYFELSAIVVANDGSIYVADAKSQKIDMLVPKTAGGAAGYETQPLIQKQPRPDCGTGRIRRSAVAAEVDTGIRTSLSAMCIGTIRALAIDDSCPAAGGRTRLLIAQELSDFGNIIEVVRPCNAL